MTRRFATFCLAALTTLGAAACSGDDKGPASLGPNSGNSVRTSATGTSVSVGTTPDAGNPSSSVHGPVTQASLIAPGVTSNTVGGPRVACEVEITGDVIASFNAYDDRSAFSSDYYLSEQEIADAAIPRGVTTLPGGTMPTYSAPARPEGTAPLTGWFLLNCQGGDISVSIFSHPLSTRDDVPFDNRKYTIAAADSTDDDHTEFFATASFFADPSLLYQVAEGARIKIDRFDARGAAGSFVIPMTGVGSDTSIVIKGSFVVACRSGANCRP